MRALPGPARCSGCSESGATRVVSHRACLGTASREGEGSMSPCVASGERSVGRTHTATTGGASCRRRTRARPGTLRCSTRTSSSLPPWSGCSPSRTWSTALRRCLLHPSGHQTAGGGVYSESCTGGPFPQTLIGFHCRWVSLTLGALRAHGDRLGLGVVLASGTRVVGDALVEHLVLAGLVRGPERRRRVRQRCAARAHAALDARATRRACVDPRSPLRGGSEPC